MANPGRGAGRGRGRPPNSTRHGSPKGATPFGEKTRRNRPPQDANYAGRHPTALMTYDEVQRWEEQHERNMELNMRARQEQSCTKEVNVATLTTTTAEKKSPPNPTMDTNEKDDEILDVGNDEEAQKPAATTDTKNDTTRGNTNNKEENADTINLTEKSVYFASKNTHRDTSHQAQSEDKQDNNGNNDNEDNKDDDDTAYEEEESMDTSDELMYDTDEDEEVQLPPLPPTKKPPTLTFSVLQIRAEFSSTGNFEPIPLVRNLLKTLTANPLILGCASKENQIYTDRNFPKSEKEFKELIQVDFCQLSSKKHRMTIVMDLATRESLDATELKTKTITTYLQANDIFLDTHRFFEIATAEVGFFVGFHDRITNRHHLDEFIADRYKHMHQTEAPPFETFTKTMYCRVGSRRAFSRVVAIRTGRSDAQVMSDFLCTLATKKAFERAEFIPKGIESAILLKKIQQQNKYISNTMAFPIVGFNKEILTKEVTAGGEKVMLREYILRQTKAEKFEPTQIPDRWLLVIGTENQDKAIEFIDGEMHEMFQTHSLPLHPKYGIPYRPGSRHTKSTVYVNYTDTLETDDTPTKQFSRPPTRPRPARLQVSYAAVTALKQRTNTPTPSNPMSTQQAPTKDIQRVKQSVRQQIKHNNIELQADLQSQVQALRAQITLLQHIIYTLQQQVATMTAAFASPTSPIDDNMNATPMQTEHKVPSPRERAQKRPRSQDQSNKTTSATNPNFEDSIEDPSTKPNSTQPTPPTDPNHGLDPGEMDSTL